MHLVNQIFILSEMYTQSLCYLMNEIFLKKEGFECRKPVSLIPSRMPDTWPLCWNNRAQGSHFAYLS